jgi:hypothetical protein
MAPAPRPNAPAPDHGAQLRIAAASGYHAAKRELAAMRKCLKSFGEAAGEIGFTKPLGNYSEAEALQVIDAIVTCYTEAMVEHHEASKYPPVRGMPPTPDPMTPSSANPFADLEDDLPWEEPKGKKP